MTNTLFRAPHSGFTPWWQLCLLLFFCLLPLISQGALSEEQRAEKTRQLKQLRENMLQLRDAIQEKRETHDRLNASLARVERQIADRNKALGKIKADIRKQNRTLGAIRRDSAIVEKKLTEQQQLLARQIRSSYMLGKQEYLKLLLNLDDAASLGRVMTYYQYFNHARQAHIEQVNQSLEKLARLNQQASDEKQRLQALEEKQQQQQQALLSDVQERKQVMASIQQAMQNDSQRLQQLSEDERQLQDLLTRIQAIMPAILTEADNKLPFMKRRGRLKWPVKGQFAKRFGQLRGGSGARWQGVVISSQNGRNVRAVSHGRVAFADWLRGYGLLLIIDHGEGYMSLYGHNQTLAKDVGDWVEEGEVVATVGQSGGVAESGVYFELRREGKPLNPDKWCKGWYG